MSVKIKIGLQLATHFAFGRFLILGHDTRNQLTFQNDLQKEKERKRKKKCIKEIKN